MVSLELLQEKSELQNTLNRITSILNNPAAIGRRVGARAELEEEFDKIKLQLLQVTEEIGLEEQLNNNEIISPPQNNSLRNIVIIGGVIVIASLLLSGGKKK